jgi:hypothetical protein
MFRQSCGLDRRISLTSSVAWALCLALSACGGGGGSQAASIPPPPPTPAPTPTPTGTIDVQTSWLNSQARHIGLMTAFHPFETLAA